MSGRQVGGMTLSGAADASTAQPTAVRCGHRELVGDRHAGDPRGQVSGQRDGIARRRLAHDRDSRIGGATAVRDQQLDHAVGRGRRDHGIDTALVALPRLGGELVALAGAEHRDRVPVRRLDEHPGRRLGHLGRLAAHDATEADDPAVVGDHQVLRRQRPVDAVQRRQPLPLGGAADPDGTGQLVGVVAVDGAAELEHDVVGDVDGQRDRALSALREPAHHPVRRRCRRVEAVDDPGHEHRAAVRVVDDDRVAVGVRGGDLAVRRVGVGRVEAERRLAGDAAQGQGVGAVRVDLELDDLLAEAEQVAGVVAGLAGVRGQHDDALVVLAEAELARRSRSSRRRGARRSCARRSRSSRAARPRAGSRRRGHRARSCGRRTRCPAARRSRWRRRRRPGTSSMVLPFFCGSASMVRTRPTTSGPEIWSPGFSIASSLSPSAVSRAASCSVERSAGRST